MADTADETLERIAAIQARLAHWDGELRQAVARARADGCTWREIGSALDVTQQAVTLRFGGREGRE
jgi:DNA-directed RNA polymerase specialized sigma24 family protein